MLETTNIIDKNAFSHSKHLPDENKALGEKYISGKKMAEHDSISVNVRNLINSIEQCDKSKIWQKMFISNLQLCVDRNWVNN